MTKRRVAVSFAVLLFFLPYQFSKHLHTQAAQANDGPSGNSEASIRKLIQDYVVARKTADPNKLESLFTLDADQLVSNGEWRRGRVDLVRGAVESSRREKGDRSITVEVIRFIKEDVALVDARYDVTGTQAAPRHMRTSLICQRENGVWKITAIRNMLPATA